MAINSVQVPIDLVDVALDRHFALSDQNTDPAIPSILASVPVLSAIISERDLQPYDVLNGVAVENEIKYVYFLSLYMDQGYLLVDPSVPILNTRVI